MNLSLNIYDLNEYQIIIKNKLENIEECLNYYDNDNQEVKEFYKKLLKLSNYKCYYCGHSLVSNNNKEVLYDKEHIINKKIQNQKNKALNKCILNLIPICKTCNSKKTSIYIEEVFRELLLKLEDICEKNGRTKCNFNKCLEKFKEGNFDPFSREVKFDILDKYYTGDLNYVNQFSLNKRTKRNLISIKKAIYDINFSFLAGGFIKYLKEFSQNTIDDEFINFLYNTNLINDFGTLNINKINNIIETITMLEEFE